MELEQLLLTEHQKTILMRYIRERRYGVIIGLWVAVIFLVMTAAPAILDLQLLLGSFKTHAAGAPFAADLLARYHRRSFPGEFVLLWLGMFIFALVAFVRNFGVRFGPGCDLDCVRRDDYFLETAKFVSKSEDHQKHPYYLYDDCGKAYLCPVFLDWKNAQPGRDVLLITLRNGRGYAMLPEEKKPENWWEEDPY